MREKLCYAVAAIALAASAQAACAMSSESSGRGECRVTDGKELPAETGGEDALCQSIRQALAAKLPGVGFTADVRVLSRSSLSATIVAADGRKVPEMRHQVMDATLSRKSFERFANSLAAKLAAAPVKSGR